MRPAGPTTPGIDLSALLWAGVERIRGAANALLALGASPVMARAAGSAGVPERSLAAGSAA